MSELEEIKAKLKQKQNEELLAIWKDKKRDEWQDGVFDAVQQILAERGIDVSDQAPIVPPSVPPSLPIRWLNDWWRQNGKYVKAWGCHTLVLTLLDFGADFALKHLFLCEASFSSFRSYAVALRSYAVTRGVILMLEYAVNFFLFRFLVLTFIVRQETWSTGVPEHPYRPYVRGWLNYIILTFGVGICLIIILNFGVLVVTGKFSFGGDFASIPWLLRVLNVSTRITWLLRVLVVWVCFFIFRMAVRKYVLPCNYEGGKIWGFEMR